MSRRLFLCVFAALIAVFAIAVSVYLLTPIFPLKSASRLGSAISSSAPMASPSAPAIAPSALAAVGGPGSATVADLNIAPGTALHEVKKGDSVPGIVRQYLPQTKFMTGSELEAGLRKTNLDLKGIWPKPGTTLIVPEFIAGPWIEKPVAKAKDYEVRAIYLTGTMAGSARGLEIIHKWRNAGGNAVVFDVKDSDGLVNVPFQHPLAPPTQRVAIRNLPKFTRYLHGLGLHAIARIAVFRDEHIAVHHPEMTIRSRRSGEPWKENGKLVWADPSRSEIWDYNIALARFAAESGADEVQFDYVRFPAEGDQKDAKFAYETEHPQWKRSDAVTHFLEKAHSQLWPMGVLLSLDVFGIMAWQRPVDLSHTGQNIPEMARHCDILSPMIYPSHFFGMDGYALPGDAAEHFISESMERFQKITAGSGVVLRPWLQAFGWKTKTYSPEYIITQVRVAHEKGGIGFLFWNASNDYGKPFAAMPVMRATPGKFFRGDEIGSTALPAVDKTLSQPDASSKGQ